MHSAEVYLALANEVSSVVRLSDPKIHTRWVGIKTYDYVMTLQLSSFQLQHFHLLGALVTTCVRTTGLAIPVLHELSLFDILRSKDC